MKDIAVDGNFSAFLDPNTNDIATVEGREAFEQAVVIALHQLENGTFGDVTTDTLDQKIRQIVTRVARGFDQIENIADLRVKRSTNKPGTYEVNVTYNTGDTFVNEGVV